MFGHVSQHFRPGAPVRKWHYDKVRYTQRRTSRPQSPATRFFSGMSAACTFSSKSIIQVHIEPKNLLVPRRSAVLTKIFPFSKEESNGKYADGRKISKAKTITVPDTVPRKQIEQYVNHAAVELERVFKIGYAEYGEMSFGEYSRHWLSRQLKYSQGTRESYRRILEKVYPYIGDIAIAKLRPLALENMLAELRKMQHHGTDT